MAAVETAIHPLQAGELANRDLIDLRKLEISLCEQLDKGQLDRQEKAALETYLSNIRRALAVVLSDDGEF